MNYKYDEPISNSLCILPYEHRVITWKNSKLSQLFCSINAAKELFVVVLISCLVFLPILLDWNFELGKKSFSCTTLIYLEKEFIGLKYFKEILY